MLERIGGAIIWTVLAVALLLKKRRERQKENR